MTYRIGIDIGGTFTDFALVDDTTGHLFVHKQLTTPTDPSKSVLSGVVSMLEENSIPITEISARNLKFSQSENRNQKPYSW